MAKRFGGFTPEQMGKIIPEMQGMQADEQAKFLAATPGAAVRVGKMAEAAQKRIGMSKGGMVKSGYAEGGYADQQAELDKAQAEAAAKAKALSDAQQKLALSPEDEASQKAVTAAEAANSAANAGVSGANSALKQVGVPTSTEANAGAFNDPTSMVGKADVVAISEEDKAAGNIDSSVGQAGDVGVGTTTTATTATDVTAPDVTEAATYEPLEATAGVEDVLSRLEAATGKPSADALADAATMKPEALAQLGLSVAQIEQAQTVKAPDARKVEEGEMVSGSTVDRDAVDERTGFEAATGSPSSDATVQGQLTGLMEDFEGSEPPAWAAGALRGAAAAMAARGLSSSSMAGQAMIQAAMESAMPIAVQDAKTNASFETQNLSNKQQAAMFGAEQRAKFLDLEFSQDFQARVVNASKVSDIANINFSAEQQIALENARMAQTVDLTNLNATNAKVMADAAAMTQLDLTNLDNRQKAQVQNAQAFLEMDMANLDNEQQVSMFKTQQTANALLSDAAAANAASQFNASSKNQTDQFFANLTTQVAQFNNAQTNAMAQFNAGETNAMEQFNTLQQNQRDQFNAQNHLVVAQANAQWSQNITTTENAAANQANRDQMLAANNLTTTAYNNLLQQERDVMSWAWSSAESAMERDTKIMIADIEASATADSKTSALSTAAGGFLSRLAVNAADHFWNK
jgi:hypothetical protein